MIVSRRRRFPGVRGACVFVCGLGSGAFYVLRYTQRVVGGGVKAAAFFFIAGYDGYFLPAFNCV